MANNQWMYSGHTGRNQTTVEWSEKTDVFLKEILRRPMRIIPQCPCAKWKNRLRRGNSVMTLHLRTYGKMPNFTMPVNFGEQERAREEVM